MKAQEQNTKEPVVLLLTDEQIKGIAEQLNFTKETSVSNEGNIKQLKPDEYETEMEKLRGVPLSKPGYNHSFAKECNDIKDALEKDLGLISWKLVKADNPGYYVFDKIKPNVLIMRFAQEHQNQKKIISAQNKEIERLNKEIQKLKHISGRVNFSQTNPKFNDPFHPQSEPLF